jgi:hypothetical protein
MCKSCEAMMINGVLCHEEGCPEAYKDYKEECAWCGADFIPEYAGQNCCSDSCYCEYNGIDIDEDEETEEEE